MDVIASGAIQEVDPGLPAVLIAPQASSDDEMVSLWLARYRSAATRTGYALDARAFRTVIDKPLRTITVRDLQAFGATLPPRPRPAASPPSSR